jgi:hypothetical protein
MPSKNCFWTECKALSINLFIFEKKSNSPVLKKCDSKSYPHFGLCASGAMEKAARPDSVRFLSFSKGRSALTTCYLLYRCLDCLD